jgi:hypothetical protein
MVEMKVLTPLHVHNLAHEQTRNMAEAEKGQQEGLVDVQAAPTFDAFLDMYTKLRDFYGVDNGQMEITGKIPPIRSIVELYKGCGLKKDDIVQRRWLVAQELLLLDAMIRDMAVLSKYSDMTTEQQFLTRAVDHFTKEVNTCESTWDTTNFKFVVAIVGDDDTYELGNEATFEDCRFFFRLCRDYTYADLLLTKFEDEDLDKLILAPLCDNALQATSK